MRAFAIDAFGETGTIREMPEPEPAEGDVVLGVKVAGLNGTDIATMNGMLKDYMEHRFPLVPGIDASGVVERVGPGVDGYREGDEIYGYVRRPMMGEGTLADRVALPVSGIAHKPNSLSYDQAAVIWHSALTAAAAVEAVGLRPGDRLVLLGATGGVGSYATQLASETGANVIAVTLGEYGDYARSMGAAEVVDYRSVDAAEAIRARHPDGVEAVIDLVGIPDLVSSVASLLRRGGRLVSTVLPPDIEALAARGCEGTLATRYAGEHRFPELCARVADGSLKLPAVQTFSFDKVGEAIALQATRHVRGKLAVRIGESAT
ncbi:MAG: NADP-dependent oxidoreductase [Chloroflexota bacterium]|nr:NADP-dependent oxidoreductase [Chloroflexota bacterium]